MNSRIPILTLVLCYLALTPLLSPAGTSAAEEEVVKIPTRDGVTQSFVILRPAGTPAASVILFAGGGGKLKIRDDGIRRMKNNFLVRSRRLFAAEGFLVAVIDAPSDRQRDSLRDFRIGEEHASDIAAVMAYLRQQAAAPVWLIGTSRGTLSAAHGGASLQQDGPAGIVLTSSVTRLSRRMADSLRQVDLKAIRVPTLVVHHKDDDCYVTPYYDMEALMGWLENAPRKELLSFEGGNEPVSDECQPLSPHGYFGIEDKVVAAIAGWIKKVNAGR